MFDHMWKEAQGAWEKGHSPALNTSVHNRTRPDAHELHMQGHSVTEKTEQNREFYKDLAE